MSHLKISLIIPAKNEGNALETLLPEIQATINTLEIIVVNDGSTDNTVDICNRYGVKVISHPYSKGNGASIKSGTRVATGEVIVFMDGDGQHSPRDIPKLLEGIKEGNDLVVGARKSESQANIGRTIANGIYNSFASYMVNQPVKDLTSGFRAVVTKKFKEFIYLLPNGFSYPSTSTLAFFRAGYNVKYIYIDVKKREGKSHIKPFKDGIRFLLIIFKVGTLFSPLKVFLPISILFFISGIFNYFYTYFTDGRFTNMSMLLLITAILVFLIGLVSEQITSLMYQNNSSNE